MTAIIYDNPWDNIRIRSYPQPADFGPDDEVLDDLPYKPIQRDRNSERLGCEATIPGYAEARLNADYDT